jgi:hypothetical protein
MLQLTPTMVAFFIWVTFTDNVIILSDIGLFTGLLLVYNDMVILICEFIFIYKLDNLYFGPNNPYSTPTDLCIVLQYPKSDFYCC